MSSPETQAPPAADPPVLAFRAGGREFALDIRAVVAVTRYADPTPLHGRDPAVLGIAPLRGRMVTLIDPVPRLVPGGTGGARTRVIVIAHGGDLLGLVVDAVSRVCAPGPPPLDLERLLGGLP